MFKIYFAVSSVNLLLNYYKYVKIYYLIDLIVISYNSTFYPYRNNTKSKRYWFVLRPFTLPLIKNFCTYILKKMYKCKWKLCGATLKYVEQQ